MRNYKRVTILPNVSGQPRSAEIYIARVFIVSAAAVLVLTGVAKLISATGRSPMLEILDPIFLVPFRQLLIAAGVLEVAVAAACAFRRSHALSPLLVAWLATLFFSYRLGLSFMGWKKPCSCLGSLTDALHLNPTISDRIAKVILSYLIVGSYCLVIWLRHLDRHAVSRPT